MIMKYLKITNVIAVLTLSGLVFYGCEGFTDLETENPNQPDTERALADAGDVETLVSSQYDTWFTAVDMSTPIMAFSVASGEATASWGNFGMQDFGTIPRPEFNNSPGYAYAAVAEAPWSNLYAAISSANDGMFAFELREDPLELGSRAETDRIRSFTYFILGLSYTSVGAIYDQGFIVDPTLNLEEDADQLETHSYEEVHAHGMDMFQEAVEIAENSDFEIVPARWMRKDNPLTKDEYIGTIYAYMARHLAKLPRDGQERDDQQMWESISEYAQEAIDRGAETLNLIDNVAGVWSYRAGRFAVFNNPLWTRASYFTIGHQDESGTYEDWLNTDYGDRTEFIMDTPDARVAGQEDVEVTNDDGEVVDTLKAGQRAPGEYFAWVGGSFFTPGRGTYFFSEYDFTRTGGNAGDPIPQFRRPELELYHAEYELRYGDEAEAVEIINRTRTENGEMEPLDAGELSTEEIWDEFYYEFRIETYGIGQSLTFYNARGWDDYETTNPLGGLVTNSPVHLPIPGSELELLEMDRYTFGGGGAGSASFGEFGSTQVISPVVQERLDNEREVPQDLETH